MQISNEWWVCKLLDNSWTQYGIVVTGEKAREREKAEETEKEKWREERNV